MNDEDVVRATVADMHRGDIVRAHAELPETMDDAQDAARTGAGSPEPAARAVTGLLDAASDTGAGPLRGVDDAPQLRDVLLFCSEI